MIKLSEIIDEIQIAPKKNPQEVFKALWDFDMHLCEMITDALSLPNININDKLDAFGFEDDDIEKAKILIEECIKYVKPDDVWVAHIDDSNFNIVLKKTYKYIAAVNEDRSQFIVLHNWPTLKL